MFGKKNKKIGLVLGGGGARGFAHLGVYKVLEEQNIKPDYISGVSAGAVIGAFLANGKSADETFKILTSKNLFEYSKLRIFKSGFVRLDGLKDDLRNKISVKNIEELKIPLTICTSNLNTGCVNYHTKGNIFEHVIASSSIPVLFTPMKINNQIHIDGGLFDNLPATPIREKCDVIIGVNISPVKEIKEIKGIIDIAVRTFQLTTHANTQKSIDKCDVYIAPEKINEYHLLELNKASEMFEIGYNAAKKIDFNT